ncbi:transposase [Rhodopirellula sp. MGV]|uniref:transposase n=1 Tax=Rhodopirellula sp. MGV TaxID=2023130 RepID=UPI000B9613BF|nr:transposase [Rhodopirellula sp. MGV]OYP35843.1 hypothetical protein CGZ80_10655 [Rhodopirellula sp. MGV]
MESTTSGPAVSPRTRRYLSADTLFALLRQRFETVQDPRKQSHLTFTLPDVLASGLAMFSLKDPSLLAYGERQDDPSLKNVFGIKSIPSDTQFRDILDPIEVDALNEAFADVFAKLQRGGVLEQFRFIGDGYLVAIDGTDYFGSSNVRCENCLEKKSKDGTTRYAHQAVVAAMIHPKLSVVIPMAVEPIVKQDGEAKNDCERNATKCLLKRIKKQHPMLKLTITEDGLSSNTPHIADCKEHGYHFILDAKPGDHAHLFEQVVDAGDQSRLHVIRTAKVDKKGSRSETQLAKRVPLNKSNPDLLVNYVGRSDLTADGDIKSIFSWVADHRLTAETVLEIARDCRCRWRIENETFNTLKNQGYHFEHNCGHRKKSLSTVLLILMMFAFVVDQVQQACCPLFQAVLAKLKSCRSPWHRLAVRSNRSCSKVTKRSWKPS